MATIQAAAAYDWGIQASLALDTSGQETTYVAALNAHILHLLPGSSTTLSASLQSAQHATALLEKGIAAVQTIKTRPANSLFDWPALPPGSLPTCKRSTRESISC
ncbi:MAG: hypothetical protein ABSC94_30940 [Polyangiaceae bacterium]